MQRASRTTMTMPTATNSPPCISGSTISRAASSSSRAAGRRPTRRKRSRNEADQIADLIGRLDRRLDQFANALAPRRCRRRCRACRCRPRLDRAVAEIAARQRALNGEPADRAARNSQRAHRAAPHARAAAASRRCRRRICPAWKISCARSPTRSKRCARPGVEEAINALRAELGEIGRALNDAMPRRAIDAIEKQIAGLTQRIAEGRQAGVDGGALAGIEHGLAEVRDALRGLTPAENLVGFNEAVAALAHKIDLIVAQKDPATLAAARARHHHVARHGGPRRLQRRRRRDWRPKCRRWPRRSITWRQPAAAATRSTISSIASPRSPTRWPSARRAAARCRRAGSAGAVDVRQDRADPAVARRQCRGRPSRGSHRQAGGAAGRFRIRASAIWKRSSAGWPICWCISRICAPTRTAAALRADRFARRRHAQARHRPHPGRARGGERHARPCRRPAGHDRKGYPRRSAPACRDRQKLPSSGSRSARSPSARSAMPARKPPPRAGTAAAGSPPRAVPPLLHRPRPERLPPAAPAADQSRPAARSAARARIRTAADRANAAARIAASEAALAAPGPLPPPGGKSGFIAAARRAAQARRAASERAARRAPNQSKAEEAEPRRCAPK